MRRDAIAVLKRCLAFLFRLSLCCLSDTIARACCLYLKERSEPTSCNQRAGSDEPYCQLGSSLSCVAVVVGDNKRFDRELEVYRGTCWPICASRQPVRGDLDVSDELILFWLFNNIFM